MTRSCKSDLDIFKSSNASSNFLLAAEKQTRNKKTYYNSPAKENLKPKATKNKETTSGKSSLKKRELK